MQNIDYSRKLKREERKPAYQPAESRYTHTNRNTGRTSILNFFQGSSQPISFLYLFIGAVLLFTSGLVVGMKIDQRENYFSNNEVNSFRNVNSNNGGQDLSIDEASSDESIGNKPQQSSDSDESFNTAQETGKSTRTALPSIQKDLKYPPRLGQVNYIIQIGTFSREDANKWGAQLIKERQEFQGRLFRTSTGKLYLGYYYNLKEAKQTLKRVKKFRDGVFEEAGIKNIHF